MLQEFEKAAGTVYYLGVPETFQMDLTAALRREYELGRAILDSGESLQSAARFAAGAGRHGAPAG